MQTIKNQLKSTHSKKSSILIVEDERDIADLLTLVLTKEGYIVEKSFTANEANRILESALNLPDLILLDIKMPGLNGIDFCQKLKQSEKHCHIPIIMISALVLPKDIELGYACGAIDYIVKPWNNDDLLSRIKSRLLS